MAFDLADVVDPVYGIASGASAGAFHRNRTDFFHSERTVHAESADRVLEEVVVVVRRYVIPWRR